MRHALSLVVIAYALTDQRAIIDADVRRWSEILPEPSGLRGLLGLPEFRSLFYFRLSHGNLPGQIARRVLLPFFPGQAALFLNADEIGPGRFLQHAFATIVAAESVGANCWINQQVTIGYKGLERPVIEDEVEVRAGAKVLGGVRVGRGSIVGANAVVLEDVPPDSLAVGVPAVARPRRRGD
jgi:serine O-acetyltransferase